MGGLGLVGLWVFLVVVIAVSTLLAVGSIWLAHHSKLADSVGREENSALSPFLTCVALVFGALLGFTVVVAWEQFSSAETHVANEASTLTTMYRQTVAMPVPEQTQMRELLRKYTKAAQGPEWAQQESGGGTSDSARAAITQMYRVLGGQSPDQTSSVTGEFFGQLTVLTSERNTRVLDAKPRIPWLLWCGLLFGAVVFIGLMGSMNLKSGSRHVVLSSAVAVLLGLLLYIVFCLDHPFGSQLGVTSEPFEHSLEVFDAVDRGT